MAAYSDLVSLSQTLDTILHPPQLGFQIFQKNRSQQESLREKVSFLHDFLENSSPKTSNPIVMENIEIEIRNAAYMAESLVVPHMPRLQTEHFAYEDILLESMFLVVINVIIFLSLQRMLLFSVKYVMPVAFKYVILVCVQISVTIAILRLISAPARNLMDAIVESDHPSVMMTYVQAQCDSDLEDLNQVIEKFESIKNEVIKIKDTCAPEDMQSIRIPMPSPLSRRDSGGSRTNAVVGFDSDLDDLKGRLIEDYSKLEVVSVVGMGGIGKTTLAREIYDDSYIVSHFDTRAWVTVSQECSMKQVLLGLLDSAKLLTEQMSQNTDGKLLDNLYKHLIGKRYLIVMDDIWDTDIWDAVRKSFPQGNKGSRILLTTRISDVALYTGSSTSIHRMHFLSQDDSWNLLCKKVFEEKDCPHELEEIGKEIARNCHGLPLAIAVIGGLLSKASKKKEYWSSFAINLSSVVSKDDAECMEILSLSYNHLPHRLRPCFLYMGVFPEDHEIPILKLVRLWAAEGFLKPNKSKSLESLAEEYLKDLIERNLILVSKRNSNGKIKTCNIHDLVRNLCLRKATKENFLHLVKCHDDVLQEGIKTRRRLSFHPSVPEIAGSIQLHNSGARSLLCTGVHQCYPSSFYLIYKLLRVLDVVIIRFFEFPYEITALINLRYLAFTFNGALSPSISELWNLETLIHCNWTYRQYPSIPVEILMMPKLRHLCVTPSYFPDPLSMQVLERNSFLLEHLQTLSDIRNFRCGNDILRRIPNLKMLRISYHDSASQNWSDYQLDALIKLHELETLKLYIENPSYGSEIVYPPKLSFPRKLIELTLSGCGIPWTSMTIIGSLPNLETLKLRSNACQGTEWEPVEGEFSQLKLLLLEKIDLVQWKANNTHFPRLRNLIIRSCYKLKMIPCEIGEIPTLKMIELVDCHPSAVTSAEEIREEQESFGNEDLKVRIDPRPRFNNKFYSKVLH